jgi:hypothetical protein
MITIDALLLEIINQPNSTIDKDLSKRDAKALRSLASVISNGHFFTEGQGKLLVKILEENIEKFPSFTDRLTIALENKLWTKMFRQIEQIRKLYITKIDDSDPVLAIEFTYNADLRKFIHGLSKEIENLVMQVTKKYWFCDLTEHNIVMLVEKLTPYNFEIHETVKTHYETIKSWSETNVKNQFLITSIAYPNFEKSITLDLGLTTTIDNNIILDRGKRYQYFTEDYKNSNETLTDKIASRTSTRYYVNKTEHTVTEIISSLIELKRLPILVVMETNSEEKSLKNLEILSESLEDNGIYDSVGVYFRLPNSELGKHFNSFIKDKSYNCPLDANTKIAVLQSGKLPKFFIKNSWTPMSVIALDSKMGLRHGKIATYANCCDCIIEWSDEPIMFEKIKVLAWQN